MMKFEFIFQLLPNEINGLDEMTGKLNLNSLSQLISSIRSRKKISTQLTFPKFKLETGNQIIL